MLKRIKSNEISDLQTYLESRELNNDTSIQEQVQEIIAQVRLHKEEALYAYTKQFDQVELENLIMTEQEIADITKLVDPQFIADLQEAANNITEFHTQQLQQGYEINRKHDVCLGQRVLPLNRVGVYVPGGLASYPSSVLMNVIPAKLVGVKEIIMVTPPDKQGGVNPYIVAAANLVGVDKIVKVGGAQAIAALAYGTQSIPKVDKIVGPGNAYVAMAKKLVFGKVDIDMIAGPSEILVIADENANPKYIAADLLSQAEHDPLASVVLVCMNETLVEKVEQQLEAQLRSLPKQDIARQAIANFGCAIVVDNMQEAIAISNAIAPEHLELMVEDAKSYLDKIEHAGSIFLGYYSCESIGDYFAGTNHVLPTNGTARFYSALSCDSFIKKSSYLYYTRQALLEDGHKIMNLAYQERLQAHAHAVKVRIEDEAS